MSAHPDVDVAPPPVLARLDRSHHRMTGLSEVFAGVLVRAGIAASDVPTGADFASRSRDLLSMLIKDTDHDTGGSATWMHHCVGSRWTRNACIASMSAVKVRCAACRSASDNPDATLTLSNPTDQPIEVSLSFIIRSLSLRDMKISVRGTDLWSTRSLQAERPVETPRFLLPPGETVIDFDTPGDPVKSDNEDDHRLLSFMVQDLQIRLSAPPDAD